MRTSCLQSRFDAAAYARPAAPANSTCTYATVPLARATWLCNYHASGSAAPTLTNATSPKLVSRDVRHEHADVSPCTVRSYTGMNGGVRLWRGALGTNERYPFLRAYLHGVTVVNPPHLERSAPASTAMVSYKCGNHL